MLFKIYTDGGFSFKNSIGSWAFVVLNDDATQRIERSGIVEHHKQTSQVAEIIAILNAMSFTFEQLCSSNSRISETVQLKIYSDSQYCVNTLNQWMHGWARKNWHVGKENLDLWKPMYDLKSKFHKVEAIWVKGHSGVEFNELVDKLNQKALKEHLGRKV